MSRSQFSKFEALLRNYRSNNETGLSDAQVHRLSSYYSMVIKWNSRLNLTTITQAQEFFDRHIAESLLCVEHISPPVESVWDLGTGLGIPGIPIAVLRPDLKVHLVDSNRNKTIFLEEVAEKLDIDNVRVTCKRIEEVENLPHSSLLIARAVEKMENLVPRFIEIGSGCAQIVLLGSPSLLTVVKSPSPAGFSLKSMVIPGSEKRLLIELLRST